MRARRSDENAGTQFDPRLAAMFVRIEERPDQLAVFVESEAGSEVG